MNPYSSCKKGEVVHPYSTIGFPVFWLLVVPDKGYSRNVRTYLDIHVFIIIFCKTLLLDKNIKRRK
jgi:hypothetical protein